MAEILTLENSVGAQEFFNVTARDGSMLAYQWGTTVDSPVPGY